MKEVLERFEARKRVIDQYYTTRDQQVFSNAKANIPPSGFGGVRAFWSV